MGERAGRHFLGSGIWPRCPVRADQPAVVELAGEWRSAIFGTVGPELTAPGVAYWIPGRGLRRVI